MGLYRYTARSFGRELSLLAIAVIWWIPFYFLITIALKPTPDVLQSPMRFWRSTPPPPPPSFFFFGNFSEAWKGSGSSISVSRGLQNSLIITCCTVLALIVLGSMCAYAIARRPGRLGNALYIIFVLGIILPFQLGIVPVYVALRHLHLVGKYAGMILLNTGLLMPLAVFLYTGFVRALPREYEEAAQVDGASTVRTYARVVFPLLLPVTGTVAILAGLIVWNDFFLSLIFLSGTPNATLPVAIYGFVGEYASQWNLIFACCDQSRSHADPWRSLVVAQKQLIKGFTGVGSSILDDRRHEIACPAARSSDRGDAAPGTRTVSTSTRAKQSPPDDGRPRSPRRRRIGMSRSCVPRSPRSSSPRPFRSKPANGASTPIGPHLRLRAHSRGRVSRMPSLRWVQAYISGVEQIVVALLAGRGRWS